MAKFRDPFSLALGGLLAFLLPDPASIRAAEPSSPDARSSNAVVIPFEFRRGHVMIPGGVAGTNTQIFLLDTGYAMTMLPPGLGDALQLRRTGQVTIVGIAGEEAASVFEGPKMEFGDLFWTSRRVASFPLPESGRGRRREGILGSGFFRRFVVVIDQRARTVTVHEPGTFEYTGAGEILPIRFRRGGSTPIVSATLNATNGAGVTGEFEVDTGCDSCLCLARDFTEKNQLLPGDHRSSGRSGVGGGTRTRAGRLQSLRLGGIEIEQPAADFFLDGSPAGEGLAGHIGLETFRNLTAIFDYSRQRLILERRSDGPR